LITKRLIFSLCLICSGFIARAQSDNCASATILTECVTFNATNTGATTAADDSYTPVEICAGSIDNSVWFTFTASTTGPYTFSLSNFICSGSSTLETGVFTGTCGSLTSINCDANSVNTTTVFNATAGTSYLIVVDGTLGSDCSFDALICAGCNINASFTPDVTSGAYPLTVNFTNTSTGAQFSHWDFGEFASGYDGTNGIYTYEEPGTFYVTLTTYNGICIDTITDTIVVTGPSALIIPNVFTPNADLENDIFTVQCFGIKTLDVQIFNRWGELVGSWSGVNGWWDGYSVMAGVKVSEGAYYYKVKAEGNDGTLFDEKGYLQLFR
jgi:gliding motility-associated-like protein